MAKISERAYYLEWRELRSAIAKCRKAIMAIGDANLNLPNEYDLQLRKEQYNLQDLINRLNIISREIINR